MSDSNENKPIVVGGVSGSKELRARRVHKKAKTDDKPQVESKSEAVVASEAPKAEPKKTAETAPAASKETKPKAVASQAKSKKEEAPAASAPAEPKKEAPKADKVEKPVKAEKIEKAPASKQEEKPASDESKVKLSSAVVSVPDSSRKPSGDRNDRNDRGSRQDRGGFRNDRGDRSNRGERSERPERSDRNDKSRGDFRQGGRDDKKGGFGNSGSNFGRGGGRGNNDRGGFAKDKDDDQTPRQPQKRVQKPKVESPIEEGKKSRANFAERNAFDKKKTENRDNRAMNPTDKRSRNMNDYRGMSDDDDYGYSRKKQKKSKTNEKANQVVAQITNIQLPPFITVKDFAEGIGKKSGDVIMELMKMGVMATLNQELDFDTACLLADAFGITAEPITEVTEEEILFDEGEENEENLKPRPPVVVVMGHVDHGKTSLLDRIRSASVVSGEAGGITQHIGAYTVRLKGRQITFLDTPGHEAFTTMRARGAQVTDIAILVIAADDGVMPQTVEAINHAKAAGTEIIVAINKMDKEGANPERVKQELTNYELIPEEWGGSTIMVPVSAKKGEGIDDLLEMVLLTADIMELKADPKRQAKGTVIEAKLDKNRGPVATVLVQRGTLRAGDSVVCGPMIGNIRAMYDDKGADIKKAGPSIPVEILGLPEVPDSGEILYAVTDDKVARHLVEKRKIKLREQQLRKSSRMSLDTLAANLAAGEMKDLNLIIKADVQGSVEAVIQSLEKLSNEEVRVKVIHGAVGAISESDISLAEVSDAIIIGFNVRPNAMITDRAKEAGVDIRLYSVIYAAIEDMELAMKGMLAPKFEEVVLGHVEIRETFKVSGVGTIGGAYVLDGKLVRNCEVRVVRDDIVVYTGHLASLKRMKDDVKEVNTGYECGLSIENYNDIKIGDVIEAYEMQEIKR